MSTLKYKLETRGYGLSFKKKKKKKKRRWGEEEEEATGDLTSGTTGVLINLV